MAAVSICNDFGVPPPPQQKNNNNNKEPKQKQHPVVDDGSKVQLEQY